MNLTLAIGPLVALIAGILILIVPRLLNFIVAIYLIIIGLLGLSAATSTCTRVAAGAARTKRSSGEVAPLASRQRAEHDRADAHALQPEHLQADRLAHAADLSLHAFAQDEAQLVVVGPFDARREERLAVEGEPVAQQCQRLGRERRAAARRDAHEVLLLDVAVLADQLARDAAVLRQHEEADRVDVEPAGGNEAPQVLGRKRIPICRRATGDRA